MTPYESHMQKLRDKFNIPKGRLQLEGEALPMKDDGKSLDQVVNEFEQAQRKGVKLKVATASEHGFKDSSGKKLTRLYYDFKP